MGFAILLRISSLIVSLTTLGQSPLRGAMRSFVGLSVCLMNNGISMLWVSVFMTNGLTIVFPSSNGPAEIYLRIVFSLISLGI